MARAIVPGNAAANSTLIIPVFGRPYSSSKLNSSESPLATRSRRIKGTVLLNFCISLSFVSFCKIKILELIIIIFEFLWRHYNVFMLWGVEPSISQTGKHYSYLLR